MIYPRFIAFLPRWGATRQLAPLSVVLLLFTLVPIRAHAHSRTATFSTVSVESGSVTWRLRVVAADLLGPLGLPEDLAEPQQLSALQPRLGDATAYVADRLTVFAGERACAGIATQAHGDKRSQPPAVEFEFGYRCDADASFRLQYRLFFDLDSLHSGFLQIMHQGQSVASDVFRTDNREHLLMTVPSPWQQLRRFWLLGVEHIFTGYDHLAFLAGLLLMAAVIRGPTGWRAAGTRQALLTTAKLVTAFTLAHSLTLAWAALRPNAIATAWVEPAIAFSVVLVGAENLLPRAPRRRWLLVFGFGLVHGFGFAFVLQEIGLPQAGFVRTLVAFNLGVECGQLAVVALALPVLLWLARHHTRLYTRLVLQGGSSALVLAGLVWMIGRLRE